MIQLPVLDTDYDLVDGFHRRHDYLRISLIDKCNLRCHYCMPTDLQSVYRKDQLMSANEIFSIAEIFVKLGVKKIRLTGGEPLIRKDIDDILDRLSVLQVKLCITTNGILIDRHINKMKDTGLKSVNVSLDTLKKSKFSAITQRDNFDQVYANIMLLVSEGFNVKVNVVVMKNTNEDELTDFIALTEKLPLHVRFIEFMPFEGNDWAKDKVVGYEEMLRNINSHFNIEKLTDPVHSTSKKYKIPGYTGTFAFITTMSTPFCSDCNRLRLTADGKMKNCLFSKNEVDLLEAFRNGHELTPIIKSCLLDKKATLGGQPDPNQMENRSMILIGG